MCGLCLSCHITLCVKEGILEFLHDLTVKLLIFCCHIILSKSLRHFYEKSGGICIVCSAGQIIWSCTKIASLFCIQSNPVTKLQLIIPDIIHSMGTHEIDPSLHAIILSFQNILVSIHQIHGPRVDDCRIGPCCCRMRSLAEKPVAICSAFFNVRNYVRYAALRCLVNLQITKPFLIEGICIHQIGCCTAENLRIASPAKTLITLRTVCRHIQEITLQSPQEVMVKLVQKRV